MDTTYKDWRLGWQTNQLMAIIMPATGIRSTFIGRFSDPAVAVQKSGTEAEGKNAD